MAKIKMVYNPLSKEEKDKFDKSQQEFYEKYIKAQKGGTSMDAIIVSLICVIGFSFSAGLYLGYCIFSRIMDKIGAAVDNIDFLTKKQKQKVIDIIMKTLNG